MTTGAWLLAVRFRLESVTAFLPLQLMDVGHHHDDYPLCFRCKRASNIKELLREALFEEIREKDIRWSPTRR